VLQQHSLVLISCTGIGFSIWLCSVCLSSCFFFFFIIQALPPPPPPDVSIFYLLAFQVPRLSCFALKTCCSKNFVEYSKCVGQNQYHNFMCFKSQIAFLKLGFWSSSLCLCVCVCVCVCLSLSLSLYIYIYVALECNKNKFSLTLECKRALKLLISCSAQFSSCSSSFQ
jgi:hypothetical protein